MKNNQQLIKQEMFGAIRMEMIKGEPWFCLADICNALELTSTTKVSQRLEEDDLNQSYTIDSLGRKQQANFVNESGLYEVVIRSDSAKAKPFRRWITKEVLPSIRKYGKYVLPKSKEAEREEKQATLRAKRTMLKEVSKHLTRTDERLIAKKLYCSSSDVFDVLSGDTNDVTILRESFERALVNSKHGSVIYSRKGCERMVSMLRGERESLE